MNVKTGIKVMAIGAHPDDIEYFMGGTLLKYKKRECEICYVVATDGSKGGKIEPNKLIKIRKNESKYAASFLDTEPIFLDFPDGELIYDQKSYNIIRGLIHDNRPDIIFTHNPADYHPDHRVLSQLVSNKCIKNSFKNQGVHLY
ncbi:PIG-L deacetylase family protein [Thermoflavimicrobium daqui]|uniref:PIG-L family deacetylase n=1 Tax=Thermoflavimicrobium daqui TaxID=2137476 RepID=A0A364K6M4_9BACL|nr:PIG-L family deacetylase [Thermoflavimicrobium daqui]RAL25944.1 hypothetical protein DL897_07690 [Thermoflavimicrobium daqui]